MDFELPISSLPDAEATMKIAYSPDADVLTIQLREGKTADSRDVAEGVIAHLSAKGQLLSEFNEDNGDCGFEE